MGFFTTSTISIPSEWIKGVFFLFLMLSISSSWVTCSSVNVNKFMVSLENHRLLYDISTHSLYLLKINQIKLQRDWIYRSPFSAVFFFCSFVRCAVFWKEVKKIAVFWFSEDLCFPFLPLFRFDEWLSNIIMFFVMIDFFIMISYVTNIFYGNSSHQHRRLHSVCVDGRSRSFVLNI